MIHDLRQRYQITCEIFSRNLFKMISYNDQKNELISTKIYGKSENSFYYSQCTVKNLLKFPQSFGTVFMFVKNVLNKFCVTFIERISCKK